MFGSVITRKNICQFIREYVEGAQIKSRCVNIALLPDNLNLINPGTLGFWLCERQLSNGELNGRPEKLPDICYSWWVFGFRIVAYDGTIDHAGSMKKL